MATAEIPKTRGVLWNSLRKTASSRFYANGGLPQDEAVIAGHSVEIAMRHYRELSPISYQRVTGATEAPTGARTGAGMERTTRKRDRNARQVV
jgi:hypothetical protein